MADDQKGDKSRTKRFLSIDYLRGLAVLLMLVYDYIPFFTKDVPLIFQHGRPDMLLPGDFIAPLFIFIMGVSLAVSVTRRRARGLTETAIFLSVIRRAFILFALGFLINNIRVPLFGGEFNLRMRWGVLEALGTSYLVSYLVMRLKPMPRIVVIAAGLSLHTSLMLYYPPYLAYVQSYSHGSPVSFITWGAIGAFGMIAGERLMRTRDRYEQYLFRLGGFSIIVGAIVGLIDPPRKDLVTSSYALITAGGSAIMFAVLYYFVETVKVGWMTKWLKPLAEFGQAAFTAFILQYVIAGYFIWYFDVNEKLCQPAGIGLAAAMIAAVWIIVVFAKRLNLIIRI